MSVDYGAVFADEISRYRAAEVKHAARSVLDAGFPPDVVRRAAFLAGLAWDETHPRLARRAQAATS